MGYITHSIAEINELLKENNERIISLANEMEILIEIKGQTDDKTESQNIGNELNQKLNEIENLEKVMQHNANTLNEWMEAKKVNEENRERIQAMFTNIQSSKKKDILEMQIKMRKLKLEKADLHFQNLQIRKEVMMSKRQNESKEKKLQQLYTEIEQMKRDLASKDRELARSKQILDKKDEEIRSMKKVSGLTQDDIKLMAGGNQAPIEVLQQIALNHQISPNFYSPSGLYQNENYQKVNHII
jgi:chromosome segregation ATPase